MNYHLILYEVWLIKNQLYYFTVAASFNASILASSCQIEQTAVITNLDFKSRPAGETLEAQEFLTETTPIKEGMLCQL